MLYAQWTFCMCLVNDENDYITMIYLLSWAKRQNKLIFLLHIYIAHQPHTTIHSRFSSMFSNIFFRQARSGKWLNIGPDRVQTRMYFTVHFHICMYFSHLLLGFFAFKLTKSKENWLIG